MTATITAGDAGQLLALIPRVAGFHPVRSVVLLPFRGSRSLGVLRVDLPPHDAPHDAIAATLIGMVCKVQDADGLTIAVYVDGHARTPRGALAYEALMAALRTRAHACGLRVVEALCVGSDGWGSYVTAGAALRSLPVLDETLLPAEVPEPAGDQCAGAAIPAASRAQRTATARALRVLSGVAAASEEAGFAARGSGAAGAGAAGSGAAGSGVAGAGVLDPRGIAAVASLDDVPGLAQAALGWPVPDVAPFDAAALLWCLERPSLRDIALVQWCGGTELGREALAAQRQWERGADYPVRLAAHLWGDGPRPDAARLTAALEVVRAVIALAPRARRAGALAAAGWLCWALGRSSHAFQHIAEALRIDPAHGFAGLVAAMIDVGHLPEWAFQRPDATRST